MPGPGGPGGPGGGGGSSGGGEGLATAALTARGLFLETHKYFTQLEDSILDLKCQLREKKFEVGQLENKKAELAATMEDQKTATREMERRAHEMHQTLAHHRELVRSEDDRNKTGLHELQLLQKQFHLANHSSVLERGGMDKHLKDAAAANEAAGRRLREFGADFSDNLGAFEAAVEGLLGHLPGRAADGSPGPEPGAALDHPDLASALAACQATLLSVASLPDLFQATHYYAGKYAAPQAEAEAPALKASVWQAVQALDAAHARLGAQQGGAPAVRLTTTQ